MEGKYKVITLCGSTRFKDEFIELQKRLTLEGNIVISVGLFGHSGDDEVWEDMDEGTMTETKRMLDDMHKRKIDMADEIYVVNVDGYIGESTQSEIEYAEEAGKEVRYLFDPYEFEYDDEDDDRDVLQEIIDVLYDNKGLKAKEIANKLGILKGTVNHYLYAEEGDRFKRDHNYRWYISEMYVEEDDEYEFDDDEYGDDEYDDEYDDDEIEDDEEVNPKEIEGNDFLVITGNPSCLYKEHDVMDITASVKVMNGKGKLETVLIPALYCDTCEQFYMLEPEYRKLKVRGTPICKVVTQEVYRGIRSGKIELNTESLLHSLGYNVSEKEGLSTQYRHNLLKTILRERVMTRMAVLSHLDYLIKRNGKKEHMETAKAKWEDDRYYVSRLDLSSSDSVSVDSIRRKAEKQY